MDKKKIDMIYLVSCAVNDIVPENTKTMDLDGIFDLANSQLLSATVSFGLASAGVKNENVLSSIGNVQRKIMILENEKESLFKKLEDAGIWYMPLKGAILKDYYPRFGMREMADYDILYDATRSDDLKAIMEDLGFTTERYDTKSNHDVYFKKPVINFEMHRSLFGVFHDDKLSSYYANVKDRLIKDEDNNYGYHFTPEDFYVYMIAHEYKHYSRGGTGIRSLLDTYVYLKKYNNMDWHYIDEQVRMLDVKEFEEKNRELALKVFDSTVSEDVFEQKDIEMLEYMLGSGVYGTMKNVVLNSIKRNQGGKLAYIGRRFFLSMDTVKKAYPLFYRYKILLPVLPFYRMYLKKARGRSMVLDEMKALKRKS